MRPRVRIPDYINPDTEDRVGEVINVVTLWRERPALLMGTTFQERDDIADVKLDRSGRIVRVPFEDCELIAY
jgi:hypothetical protein